MKVTTNLLGKLAVLTNGFKLEDAAHNKVTRGNLCEFLVWNRLGDVCEITSVYTAEKSELWVGVRFQDGAVGEFKHTQITLLPDGSAWPSTPVYGSKSIDIRFPNDEDTDHCEIWVDGKFITNFTGTLADAREHAKRVYAK